MSNFEKNHEKSPHKEKRRLDHSGNGKMKWNWTGKSGEDNDGKADDRKTGGEKANDEAERRAARTSQIFIRRFEAPTPSPNTY